ncbi:MAG: DUF1080 domain-containing protein [Armatimonadota bacterium]
MARYLLVVLLLGASLRPVAVAQETGDVPDGFVPLFNGEDLTGWVVMGSDMWEVNDGIIHCTAEGRGWLRSEKEYGDLVLRAEYRIYPKGNSGIWVHAPLRGRASSIGMECQILDDHGRPPRKGGSGSFYNVMAPAKNMAKPAGEWNQVEIAWIGDMVSAVLNGQKLWEVDLMDEELNASLPDDRKASKRQRRGYIGLSKHTGPVDFRNIYIKDLDEQGGAEG